MKQTNTHKTHRTSRLRKYVQNKIKRPLPTTGTGPFGIRGAKTGRGKSVKKTEERKEKATESARSNWHQTGKAAQKRVRDTLYSLVLKPKSRSLPAQKKVGGGGTLGRWSRIKNPQQLNYASGKNQQH